MIAKPATQLTWNIAVGEWLNRFPRRPGTHHQPDLNHPRRCRPDGPLHGYRETDPDAMKDKARSRWSRTACMAWSGPMRTKKKRRWWSPGKLWRES